MSTVRRATIYLKPDIHRALRLKAAAADISISDLVNAALQQALAEDAEDLDAAAKRRAEKSIDFEQFVKSLRRRGKI
jgi:plasmid stability protein